MSISTFNVKVFKVFMRTLLVFPAVFTLIAGIYLETSGMGAQMLSSVVTESVAAFPYTTVTLTSAIISLFTGGIIRHGFPK